MIIEITLHDKEGVPVLEVIGMDEKKYVQLKIIQSNCGEGCLVDVDELRSALKKIRA